MRFGSLFSGVGGFDLGFERAGMECAWQVEWDDKASEVLAKHWPDVTRFGDVRDVGKHNLEPVELICGGFPCQDVSVAGKRAGLAGERSGLWHEFHRIIAELTPKWVVIENVPGLLSSNGGRDFAVILRGLVELRYGVSWRVLDSQYLGVAQRRRRVFIVGSFGTGRSAEVLFESESGGWHPAESRKAGEGVAYTLRANPSHGGDKGDGGVNTTLLPTFQNTGQGYWQNYDRAQTLRDVGGSGGMIANLVGSYWDGGQKADTLDVSSLVKGQMMPDKRRFPVVFDGRNMDTHEVSSTLQAKKNGGYSLNYMPMTYSKVGVRRLTPTECERLQGFPEGWTEGQADSHRYKQMGNAVTVNVAEWIGNRIVRER